MHKMSKWVVYYTILANAIGMMSLDIHLPVLSQITQEFGTSFFMAQQILIVFYIVGIIARITLGPMSDAYGRRKILLLAIDIQIIGQTMQCFAQNIEFMLMGRIVQALASGGLAILINAIILDLYTGYERMRTISISELIQPVSLILAPIIGGYLATYWGWRAGFFFLLINLICARAILTIFLQETNHRLTPPSVENIASNYKEILMNRKFMGYNIMLASLASSYMLYAVISSYIYMEKFQLSITEFMVYQTIPLIFQAICVLSYNLFKANLHKMVRYGVYLTGVVNIISILVILDIIADRSEINLLIMLISSAGLGLIFPAGMKFALDIFSDTKGTASSTLVVFRGILSGIGMFITGYFHEYDKILFYGLLITSTITILSWKFLPEHTK